MSKRSRARQPFAFQSGIRGWEARLLRAPALRVRLCRLIFIPVRSVSGSAGPEPSVWIGQRG
jgi:hypothetical protein